MPRLKKNRRRLVNADSLRITPNPTIRQYHASIMHDIMVRNPFPPDTREMVGRLAESVRAHAEAEAAVIKAKAEARLNDATAKLQHSVSEGGAA